MTFCCELADGRLCLLSAVYALHTSLKGGGHCCCTFLLLQSHCYWTFLLLHSFPGLVVCAHSSTEVSQKEELVCPGCSRNHRIQIIIELVFDLIWVGHCGCIATYNSCMPLTRYGKSKRHQAAIYAFWKV